MEKDFFLKHLEELLDAPQGSINLSESLENIPDWDSLTVLGLISLAEASGGKDLTPDDFMGVITVGDVFQLITGKQVK